MPHNNPMFRHPTEDILSTQSCPNSTRGGCAIASVSSLDPQPDRRDWRTMRNFHRKSCYLPRGIHHRRQISYPWTRFLLCILLPPHCTRAPCLLVRNVGNVVQHTKSTLPSSRAQRNLTVAPAKDTNRCKGWIQCAEVREKVT